MLTAIGETPSAGAGERELSVEVFDIVQRKIVLLVPEPKNTASELRKNSVPPLSVSNWLP